MVDIESLKYAAMFITKPTKGQVAKIEASLHLIERIFLIWEKSEEIRFCKRRLQVTQFPLYRQGLRSCEAVMEEKVYVRKKSIYKRLWKTHVWYYSLTWKKIFFDLKAPILGEPFWMLPVAKTSVRCQHSKNNKKKGWQFCLSWKVMLFLDCAILRDQLYKST